MKQKLTLKQQEELRDALYRGQIRKVVKFRLEGWTPRAPVCGTNPLAIVQSPSLAKLLLTEGASVDSAFDGAPPLLEQTNRGLLSMVKFLVNNGANVNVRFGGRKDPSWPRGTTALLVAIGRNLPKLFNFLLKAGADVNAVDQYGRNALFYAGRRNRTAMVKELVQRKASLVSDVLCGPVKNGNTDLIKLLIRKGANVDAVFENFDHDELWPDKKTLLGFAIGQVGIQGYPFEIVKLLVKGGADVNQSSGWWRVGKVGDKFVAEIKPTSPIRIAGSRGMENVMKLLWKAGAKGTLQEAMEDCSMERAAYRNSPEVMRLLIQAGADVNAVGEETGKRPIELAREKGHTSIVEILKKAGAKD